MLQIVKKLGALRRKATPTTIAEDQDGQKVDVNFYPVRVGTLLSGELAQMTQPIIQAISLLLDENQRRQDRDRHGFSVDQRYTEEIGDDAVIRQHEAIDPQLAQVRDRQREKAIKEAMGTLMDAKTQLGIGRLLTDSMRDEFDSRPSDEDVLEFMAELELPVMFACVGGFFKANASIFGDLGNQLGSLVKSQVDQMMTMDQTAPADQDESDPTRSTDLED